MSPMSLPHPHGTSRAVRMTVPCGRCVNCLQNKRADWTFRLSEENKEADTAYFVTMTYNDDYNDGSLHKEHVKDYIKRLRTSLDEYVNRVQESVSEVVKYKKLRYFVTGEYGSKTFRPHYHAIFFNMPIEKQDLFIEKWSIGTKEYEWNEEKGVPVEKKEPLGFVKIGNVTTASIHYTTKYMLDGLLNTKSFSYLKDSEGEWIVEKPFNMMSKYPPLGIEYVKKFKSYHRSNKVNYHLSEGGIKQRLPRAYKERIFSEKERKKFGEEAEVQEFENEDARRALWKKKGRSEDFLSDIYLAKRINMIKNLKGGKL